MFQSLLDAHSIVILSRNLIAGAVVELWCVRAGVVGHHLGVFERAAVGEKIASIPSPGRCDSTCRRRWAHQDGKGFNVKLDDYLPLDGAEIVIREPRAEGGRS